MTQAYQVVAQNSSEAHENKIHSDETARRYGFKGALVPGVAVYGHLTHPLVARFGEQWLGHSVSDVRFFKPAYHGEQLTITHSEEDATHTLRCTNSEGVLLAELHSSMPEALPDPEPEQIFSGPTKDRSRPTISWDHIHPNQPFDPWHWQVTEERNKLAAQQISDELPIYRTRAHPHLLLSKVNGALTREFVMPAWLHVGSEIRLRKLLKVPDVVRSQSVVIDKWRRKGHEFARIYTTYHRGDALVTDVYHTFIFSVAAG